MNMPFYIKWTYKAKRAIAYGQRAFDFGTEKLPLNLRQEKKLVHRKTGKTHMQTYNVRPELTKKKERDWIFETEQLLKMNLFWRDASVLSWLSLDNNFFEVKRDTLGKRDIGLTDLGIEKAYNMVSNGRVNLTSNQIELLKEIAAHNGTVDYVKYSERANDLYALARDVRDMEQRKLAASLSGNDELYEKIRDGSQLLIVDRDVVKITSLGRDMLDIGRRAVIAMISNREKRLLRHPDMAEKDHIVAISVDGVRYYLDGPTGKKQGVKINAQNDIPLT